MSNYPKSAIIDTCFILALYDARDSYHKQAIEKADILESLNIIIPWPCLYETLNTRLVKNKKSLSMVEKFLKKPQIIFISDNEYKMHAYSKTFEYALIKERKISLTDMVIRYMLEDTNLRINALFTFNTSDFFDVCQKYQIEIVL